LGFKIQTNLEDLAEKKSKKGEERKRSMPLINGGNDSFDFDSDFEMKL
jgi:hypothetical protein